MPGEVIRCTQCKTEFRWGFSRHAIDFAAQKRKVEESEIISDFFELNPSILREKPLQCPSCKAAQDAFEVLHKYS